MPVAAGQPLNSRFQARPRVHNRSANVDPYTANTSAIHFVECRVSNVVIDSDDASCSRTELPHPIDRAAIVSAVRARLNNDHSIDVERSV